MFHLYSCANNRVHKCLRFSRSSLGLHLADEEHISIGIHLCASPKDISEATQYFSDIPFSLEPPPSQPPLPSSTFSITGNNRPSSFITSWRWFPHGATRSLCCQPASQPAHSQSTVELGENKESVLASSFPYSPLRRVGVKGSHALAFTENVPDWCKWKGAHHHYKVI